MLFGLSNCETKDFCSFAGKAFFKVRKVFCGRNGLLGFPLFENLPFPYPALKPLCGIKDFCGIIRLTNTRFAIIMYVKFL